MPPKLSAWQPKRLFAPIAPLARSTGASKDGFALHRLFVATAHKIARTVYHILKHRVPYHDIGAAEYTQRFRERELQYLQKKVAKLGYTLAPA